ncbi:MAG: cupin domain-containing protein [bacterium]|nr:cupin domain-containing protein [bacterium]
MQYSNINQLARDNNNFRKVLFTNKNSQVVLMSIEPGDDIGTEVHEHNDQILYFVEGEGKAVVNGEEHVIHPGDVVDVPAGSEHNFINTGETALKIFTVYAPPEHEDGTVHETKAAAMIAEGEEKN